MKLACVLCLHGLDDEVDPGRAGAISLSLEFMFNNSECQTNKRMKLTN